jgi:hypothetical protein
LIIDVEFTCDVLGIFVRDVSHFALGKTGSEKVKTKAFWRNAYLASHFGAASVMAASERSGVSSARQKERRAIASFRALLIELPIYAVFVVGYFFAVLHFLQGRLVLLERHDPKTYALLAIGLMIGQAVLLEMLTSWLLRLFRRGRD